MSHDESSLPDRRTFLEVGALATAGALASSSSLSAQTAAPKPMELPRRPLGKTGIDITILDQGTGKGPDVDRLLRYGFARGVRAYDTSETYHSELTRFLTYHEHHGDRALARRLYEALPAQARDWSGADLEAARAACPNRLDFASLLRRVERDLA
jgi:hypothetical protein